MIRKEEIIVDESGDMCKAAKRNAFRMSLRSAVDYSGSPDDKNREAQYHQLEIRPTHSKPRKHRTTNYEIVYDDNFATHIVLPIPDEQTHDVSLKSGDWIRGAFKMLTESKKWPFTSKFTEGVVKDVDTYVSELERVAGK